MQAENNKYLPKPAKQHTGNHRTQVINKQCACTKELTCPGGNRSNKNQGERDNDEQCAEGNQEGPHYAGDELFKEAFDLAPDICGENNRNDARRIAHQNDRDAQKCQIDRRFDHGAAE
ncbi:hypothetical protein D3C75_853830 [compost metagenome]